MRQRPPAIPAQNGHTAIAFLATAMLVQTVLFAAKLSVPTHEIMEQIEHELKLLNEIHDDHELTSGKIDSIVDRLKIELPASVYGKINEKKERFDAGSGIEKRLEKFYRSIEPPVGVDTPAKSGTAEQGHSSGPSSRLH